MFDIFYTQRDLLKQKQRKKHFIGIQQVSLK